MISKMDISHYNAREHIDYVTNCLSEIDKTRSRATEVIKSHNDFAGLFSIKELCKRFDDPVLVSSANGMGSKLLVAIACEKYSGLGQDLVAMCVNEIAAKGAEPLFFIDYFATSNLRSVPFVKIINGIVAACDEINCALIGGETAETLGLFSRKHFDLAGFSVGVVERSKLLSGSRVSEGDTLIGLRSSGLHANGFSLVREIMFEKLRHKPNDVLWQTERGVMTVADELSVPTKLYINPIKSLLADSMNISAIAHITAGGIIENIRRIMPINLVADIDLSEITPPRIFAYLMEHGGVMKDEMLRTFNMGIGLIIALPTHYKDQALAILKESGEMAFDIGTVRECTEGARCKVKLS